MKNYALTSIAFVHLLLASAIFGFFYAYSCSVMIGLDFADGTTAINAMKAINATIKNPYFAPAFFGPPITGLLATILFWRKKNALATGAMLSATLVYILGAFFPTITINVPMNDALALVSINSENLDPNSIWNNYSTRWSFWNLVRTVASGVTLILSGSAIYFHAKQSN